MLFPQIYSRFFKILVTTNTLNIRDLEKLNITKSDGFKSKKAFEKNVIKELGDNVTQRTRFKLENNGEDGLITYILKNVGI